jgi:RNA ligase
MKMSIHFLEKLKEEVRTGMVSKIKNGDLSIYNYTSKAQYSKSLNEVSEMCRGLVLTEEGEVVAFPFSKFYNYEELSNEQKAMFSVENIEEIWNKEDGSLIVAFYWNGVWETITRGSWNSTQAISGKKLLTEKFLNGGAKETNTYCFELTGPSNINVTRGYDKDELILLGIINKETGEEVSSDDLILCGKELGFSTPKFWKKEEFSFGLIKKSSNPNFEGVVIKNSEGKRCKIKTELYFKLHKLLSGLSQKRIFELWCKKKEDDFSLLDQIPDEFYKEVNRGLEEIDVLWECFEKKAIQDLEKTKDLFSKGLSRKDVAVNHNHLIYTIQFALNNEGYSKEFLLKLFSKKFFE